jgi:hypothetical protein
MLTAHLRLDLGTEFGWAIRWSDGRAIEHDSYKLKGETDGARFVTWRAWLHDTKRRIEGQGGILADIRFEEVDFLPPKSGVYAAHVWGAYWGELLCWARHHNIDCKGVGVGTIKRLLTGNGHAPKDAADMARRNRKAAAKGKKPYVGPTIESALRESGFTIHNHNEADALALALIG